MPRSDDFRKTFESQLAELQEQLHSLQSTLSSRGADAYEAADARTREAMRAMSRQARAMGQIARDNPTSTATVLTLVALTCLGLGYLAGRSVSDDRW